MTGFRTRLLLLAGLPAAGTVAALVSMVGTGGDDVPTYVVRRERFLHRVSAEGVLRAAASTLLTPPMSRTGPLKIAWMIEDGSPVKAGEVVVRSDSTELEKTLLDGKADRDTALSKIAKARAEADVKVSNLGRDVDVARLELDSARRFESKDEEIFSRIEIIESQIDENLAARRVEHYEDTRKTQASLSRADEALLVIERRKAELKIGQAEQGLSFLEMKTSHDGIVVFRRDWRGNLPQVGDMVWGGDALAEIPASGEMEAEVQVLEADAGGLALGRSAVVVLEADPTVVHQARIRRMDNVPKPRVRGVPVQYFGVTLALERTEAAVMKPGQRVHATLLLEERPDALAVPIQAVLEVEGKNVVYRRGEHGFDPVQVVLGPSSRGRVVIEQGLEEGDVIALRDPTKPGFDVAPPTGSETPDRSLRPGSTLW